MFLRSLLSPFLPTMCASFTSRNHNSCDRHTIDHVGNSSMVASDASLSHSIKRLYQHAPYPMHYNITKHGRSTLRNLTQMERSILEEESIGGNSNHILAPLIILLRGMSMSTKGDQSSSFALDMAHEIILGVNRTNLDQAEYAATHPGMTSWSRDHPLTAEQDMVHYILHRLEGCHVGEGEHRGYDNAKYWLVGGDKMLNAVERHPVRDELRDYVLQRESMRELNLVVGDKDDKEEGGRVYEIIAGGETVRRVFVSKGEFDFFLFCDLCEKRYARFKRLLDDKGDHGCDALSSLDTNCGSDCMIDGWKDEWQEVIDLIQRKEFELLLKYAVDERL